MASETPLKIDIVVDERDMGKQFHHSHQLTPPEGADKLNATREVLEEMQKDILRAMNDAYGTDIDDTASDAVSEDSDDE